VGRCIILGPECIYIFAGFYEQSYLEKILEIALNTQKCISTRLMRLNPVKSPSEPPATVKVRYKFIYKKNE
jgi:hypothetical protein